MGKDSLIKSTAKKATPEKEKEDPKKKTTQKASANVTKTKTTKKQTKKAKPAKTKKLTSETKTDRAAPTTAAKPAKKPTLKELLFKQFDGQKPPAGKNLAAPDFSKMTAPPFISTDDPKEAVRIRTLLFKHFDMADINASAKPPAEPKPVIKESTPTKAVEQKAPPESPAQAVEAKSPKAETDAVEPSALAKAKSAETEAPEPKAVPTTKVNSHPPAEEAETQKKVQPAQAPAAEQKQPTAVPPQLEKKPVDPVMRAAKIGAILAAAVVLMIIWTSITNSSKYVIIPKRGAIEIWKGDFSPTGKSFFAVLHGYQLADPIKEIYSRKEIFPFIFGYYLNKADALLEVSGLPDYKAISDYLKKAEQFALSKEMQDEIENRTSNIQRMTLFYKAEVDASKDTVKSLESSLKSLGRVQRLTSDPAQLEALNQKIATVTAALEAAKAREAEAATAEKVEATPETAPKP